jgi:hypothetical protein
MGTGEHRGEVGEEGAGVGAGAGVGSNLRDQDQDEHRAVRGQPLLYCDQTCR